MQNNHQFHNHHPQVGGRSAETIDFTETVERILSQVEHRDETAHEPLRYSEILALSELCSVKIRPMENLGFADVDPDMTSQLIEFLQKHVAAAASVNLVRESFVVASKIRRNEVDFSFDMWLEKIGRNRQGTLKCGLEAASIILCIVNSPGIERRVINEDAIEEADGLFRHHLSKNILPALNNVGHIDHKDDKAATSGAEGAMASAKKRRRSSTGSGGNATLVRDMKKAYKFVEETIGVTSVVMERLDILIQKIPLDDKQVLNISSGALACLELDPVADAYIKIMHQLHVGALGIVTSIFRRYERFRQIIIQDLFPIMLKMPTSKKSMRTYPIQCSSVLYPEGLQSLSRSLSPGNTDPNYIQTISAMILSFVQSSVTRPMYEGDVMEKDDDDEKETKAPKIHSGLKDCQTISDTFVSLLIQRCSKKGEDGGASEFRPILSNLIDDLLLVVLIPEYPAAEMILNSISRMISSSLVRASHPKIYQAFEVTYLSTAFDALGKICSAEARILKSNKENPVRLSTTIRGAEEKHVDCYCGEAEITDPLSFCCDRCGGWYHGRCVEISREMVPSQWYCDSCQLLRIVEFEKDRNANLGELGCPSDLIDQAYCMRRLLIDYLSVVSRQSGMLRVNDAYEFHLARWINEIAPDPEKNGNGSDQRKHILPLITRLIEFWDPNESSSINAKGATLSGMLHCLSDEGRSRIVIHLSSTQSNLMLSFRRQLGLIVKLMESDSSANLRKLAVKAVEKVTESDRGYMTHPIIKKAVICRFSDEGISVREAAVSLVGSYVVHLPGLANDYHSAFMVGLHDSGVSVRKRTIKILQDILCSNPSYTSRAAACSEMLRLAADPKEDDGVRDLIYDLFLKLWLENGDATVIHRMSPMVSPGSPESPGSQATGVDGDISAGIVTPGQQTPFTPIMTAKSTRSTARKIRNRNAQKRSEIAAEQMVEVVKNAKSGEGLTNLFRELLQGVSDSDKNRKASERKKRQVLAQGHCSMLVDALIEHLLTTEENREKSTAFGDALVAIFRTIVVFSEVSPMNVAKHLDTLLPYLKADNGLNRDEESIVVSSLCNTLSRVSKVMTKFDIEKLDGKVISKDLGKITYKLGPGPCSAAVEALSSLSHHQYSYVESPFREQTLKLAKTFYTYLMNHRKESDITSKQHGRDHAQRALRVLGNICRYHEVTDDDEEIDLDNEEDEDNSASAGPTRSNVIALCKGLFHEFLEMKDPQIKCAALEALCGVFIARPRVMLNMDKSGLITKVMSPSMHNSVQRQAVRCWRDILLTEEARIESGEARRVMESKKDITVSKKISGDQDADATLFGGVLSNHSSRIFEITQARDRDLRFASLDLIGHLLRQGQLNPNEATPFLFALQGDVEEDRIRLLALKLLMTEGEKRPDMLRQRACAGVLQAYLFQKMIYPDKDEVSALVDVNRNGRIQKECVLGSVYRECIQSIKKQRQGLFRDLVGRFSTERVVEQRIETNGKKKSTKNKKPSKKISTMKSINDLALLSFTAQVLVHLPFTAAADPLYIIHKITAVLALQGPDLLDRLACFLRPYGLASSDEMDENNLTEDAIEIAARRNTPRHAKEVTRLLEPDFDTQSFYVLCCEAGCLILLLRMKEYLKKCYNLSEIRCLEYNPDVKEKNQDRSIAKANGSANFDAYLPLQRDGSEMDIDGMISHYAEFRRRMRDDAYEAPLEGEDSDEDGPQQQQAAKQTKKRRRSSA